MRSRSSSTFRAAPSRGVRLAVYLLATAMFTPACSGDGPTSSGTGAATAGAGGNGGQGGTKTTTGGTGGAGGVATTGGTGGAGGVATTGGTGGAGGVATTSGNGGAGGVVGQPPNWGPPPVVVVPPLPAPPDYAAYPTDAQGRPIVSQGPNINWVVPLVPDAMSAREKCADLVANCYAPGVRSIDACMLSAPACVSLEPWTEPAPCCAPACFTAYTSARKAGVDPLTAYQKVLYDTPICMPGVDAMLAGGAP